MRKKILIFGHYGVPNWGDEAILSGILSQIDVSKYSVTVISHNPKFTQKEHSVKSVSPPPFGVRSFLCFSWIQTIKTIKEADYIIFGGGGLWQSSPEKALKLWDWYLRIVLFFSPTSKIFCLGTSFGTIPKELLTDGMKRRLQKIKYFSVRDKQSVDILKNQWGVLPSKIQHTSDGAFFLNNNFSITHGGSNKKNITLSMREGDLFIEEEKIILNILNKKFKGYNFQFLVMQSFQAEDEKFAERYNIKKIFPKSIEQVLEIISNSHCVISSRLHSNILASVVNTPFCAIACREKTKNLFGEEFSVKRKNILDKNFEKLFSEKIEKIIENKERRELFLEKQKDRLEIFFPRILS